MGIAVRACEHFKEKASQQSTSSRRPRYSWMRDEILLSQAHGLCRNISTAILCVELIHQNSHGMTMHL